jgi:signal transduction histidine kinase
MTVFGAATAAATVLILARLALVLREQSRLTATLSERNDELRTLDVMKDHFVASVSHELRTPLTSIQGYLELVLDEGAGALNDEQRHFLAVVRRNSDRLLRLVGDLLFVAQVDAGKLDLELGQVALRELVEESVQSARPHARDAGITLELDADDVPPIRGDRVRLGQLFDNLLSNALKFTPDGGRVAVRVSTLPDRAVVEIADTGMGISATDQQRLFDRFFRTSRASEQAVPGTGLGLSIVKAIVDGHDGRIRVASAENAGTTFTVELPLAGARTHASVEAA